MVSMGFSFSFGIVRMIPSSFLFTSALENWNSQGPLVFEPYAYESLKTANEMIFGLPGLASYRLDQAEVLVSFGASSNLAPRRLPVIQSRSGLSTGTRPWPAGRSRAT